MNMLSETQLQSSLFFQNRASLSLKKSNNLSAFIDAGFCFSSLLGFRTHRSTCQRIPTAAGFVFSKAKIARLCRLESDGKIWTSDE
jgi:hypothetical protein